MKSNLILKSESRTLLGSPVSIMSKDGYVCITEAMDSIKKKRESMNLSAKEINDVLRNQGFKEKIRALMTQLGYGNDSLKKRIDYDNLTLKEFRKIGLAYRKGGRGDQKWFIDPYIFVTIAMELDPEIYATVVIWLTDGLVKNRNIAGDTYIKICKDVRSLLCDNITNNEFSAYISRMAKGMNYVVFGKHEEGIRNYASIDQMQEIVMLQGYISDMIESGFISDFNALIRYLGDKWKKRWGNINPVTGC